MSSEHSKENHVLDKSLVELNQQRMTEREKWEKMAKETCKTIGRFLNKPWSNGEWCPKSAVGYIHKTITDVIEKAAAETQSELRAEKVRHNAQYGSQQEEIDRLKAELSESEDRIEQ
jgi:hypothetical protein